jgi:hypothetical protein
MEFFFPTNRNSVKAISWPEMHGNYPGKIGTPSAKVGKNQLVVHMDKSMCHNGHKFGEDVARKTTMRVSHSVYSPDRSPCDFWFFGYAKEQMKEQIKAQDNSPTVITAKSSV